MNRCPIAYVSESFAEMDPVWYHIGSAGVVEWQTRGS
jgi:hypothetical protein